MRALILALLPCLLLPASTGTVSTATVGIPPQPRGLAVADQAGMRWGAVSDVLYIRGVPRAYWVEYGGFFGRPFAYIQIPVGAVEFVRGTEGLPDTLRLTRPPAALGLADPK